MKFQLKKEVIASLTNEAAGKVKGGTATEMTTMIPTLGPSDLCTVYKTNIGPIK